MKRRRQAECALAYALWDAHHSVKMVEPEDIEAYIAKAREVMRWLRRYRASIRVKH